MKKILIKFPLYHLELECKLNQTTTAEKIYTILPQEAKVRTWGEEIYFELPLQISNENPTLDVEIGDIGWWPEGNCFCIFFGKTPISTSNKPKPYSEVTVIGKVELNDEIIKILKQIKHNSEVILDKI
ncbi:MAG: cyclophilin-like fold protein [Endomicrobia bacterium]|nr:cyclophilin-like fold protein [Endomicrobiia bacterium]